MSATAPDETKDRRNDFSFRRFALGTGAGEEIAYMHMCATGSLQSLWPVRPPMAHACIV